MKILRFILSSLLWSVGVCALLAIALASPLVQTWTVRWLLERGEPAGRGTVRAVSARFGRLQIAELRLATDRATLTLPSLEASLPLTATLWQRQIRAQRLVAKGWVLDLTAADLPRGPNSATPPTPTPSPATTGAGAAAPMAKDPASHASLRTVLAALHTLFDPWTGPCAFASLQELELEGTVICPSPGNEPPARLHVALRGRDLTVGQPATLQATLAGPLYGTKLGSATFALHGDLTLQLETPRQVRRLAYRGEAIVRDPSLAQDIVGTLETAVARETEGEHYSLRLQSDTRTLLAGTARISANQDQMAGTWQIDWQEADFRPFLREKLPVGIAAQGEGQWQAQLGSDRTTVTGQLHLAAPSLAFLLPPLHALGPIRCAVRFAATREGALLRVAEYDFALEGARPFATARARQPFTYDLRTHQLALADATATWLEVAVAQIPLSLLDGAVEGLTFSAGEASGEFLVRVEQGRLLLQPKTPVRASQVGIWHAGSPWAVDVELSASLLAEASAQGWRAQWVPLTLTHGGHSLLQSHGQAQQAADANAPVMVAGRWEADFRAGLSPSAAPLSAWLASRTSDGTLSARLLRGTSHFEGTATWREPGAGETLAMDYTIDANARREITFRLPLKLTAKEGNAELTLAGSWYRRRAEEDVAVRLSSPQLSLPQLAHLAEPFLALGGAPRASSLRAWWGAPSGTAAERPPPAEAASTAAPAQPLAPFWGRWQGNLTLAIDRFRLGGEEWRDVQGSINLDARSLKIENATRALPDQAMALWQAQVTFDPAAAQPYQLTASTTLGEIDAGPLFGPTPAGKDPVFRGKFAATRRWLGQGRDLADLFRQSKHEFRFSSRGGGIVRLLKTTIADAIPEPTDPGSGAISTMGDIVGGIFGRKRGTVWQGQNRVGQELEALLGFVQRSAEFRYESIEVVAVRGPDRQLQIDTFQLTGPEVHLAGRGHILAGAEPNPWARPLHFELQLGVRGQMAALLATAGLLALPKEGQDLAFLAEPVRGAGTLQQLDLSAWRDFLVRAALDRTEEAKKKSAAPAAPRP